MNATIIDRATKDLLLEALDTRVGPVATRVVQSATRIDNDRMVVVYDLFHSAPLKGGVRKVAILNINGRKELDVVAGDVTYIPDVLVAP